MRAILACCVAACAIAQSFDAFDTGGDGSSSSSEFERAKQASDHIARSERYKQEAPELRDALRRESEESRQRQDRIEQLERQLRDSGIVPATRPPPAVPPHAAIVGAPAGLPPVAEEPMRGGERPLKTRHRQL